MGWIDGRLCYGRMDSQGVEKMNQDIRQRIAKLISKMQMRISDAWQAWDGAEPDDADEMWEKYGDETDAAERTATDEIMALITQAERDLLIKLHRTNGIGLPKRGHDNVTDEVIDELLAELEKKEGQK